MDAIEAADVAHLREELGDVLLQVLFHADIEADRGRMTIDNIADAECRKLIFRHPFLFGGKNASWDELKQQEKGQKTTGEAMQGVARSLPATWRAEKIQKKAAKTGFCWKSAGQALDKLAEEAQELREAVPPRWTRTPSRRCTAPVRNLSNDLPLWSRAYLLRDALWRSCPARSCLPVGTRKNVTGGEQ